MGETGRHDLYWHGVRLQSQELCGSSGVPGTPRQEVEAWTHLRGNNRYLNRISWSFFNFFLLVNKTGTATFPTHDINTSDSSWFSCKFFLYGKLSYLRGFSMLPNFPLGWILHDYLGVSMSLASDEPVSHIQKKLDTQGRNGWLFHHMG